MKENIIELSDFKNISCCFDMFLNELWIIENSNYEIINFYKIINGEPIKCFSYDTVLYIVNGYGMYAFNNQVLISFRENDDILFSIFDLNDGKIVNSIYSKDIIENNKDALLRPIGIRENNLFFLNGYYNIETKKYTFFKHELLLPYYFSNENMILFCNNNYFALYNIEDENIVDLNIKIPDGYISNFYLDGTELYYSKIKHTWLNVILTLDYGPVYRHYYKYNILTKKNIRIKTPTEFVDIIGIIK
jgi:hypothetical protein